MTTAVPNVSYRPLRIALVAGEASGDLLGGGLIQQLKLRFPNAEFKGIGGDAMRQAGCDTWWDCSQLAVMGILEVLRHLPRLWRLKKQLQQRLADWQPDMFIGIDAPDFNLPIERALKSQGIRTVHYVSPTVWAWREKRAQAMQKTADLVLCLFPMEPPIYAKYGVDARFVGHPMADSIPFQNDPILARKQLGLDKDDKVLAVLPGSRSSEVDRLAPTFLKAAALVAQQINGIHIVIPAANAPCHDIVSEHLLHAPTLPNLHLLDGQSRTALIAADVVLLASGTATLETMLVKRPMVVGYKISSLTYYLVKLFGLIKVTRFALPNILSGRDLAPEFIQEECTPEALSNALLPFFNYSYAMELQGDYLELHQQLQQNASISAADAVAELLQ